MNQMLDRFQNTPKLSLMTLNNPVDEGAKYVPVAEAAIRLGISVRTVRRMIIRGALKAKRLTPIPRSSYRVLVSSIDEFEKKTEI